VSTRYSIAGKTSRRQENIQAFIHKGKPLLENNHSYYSTHEDYQLWNLCYNMSKYTSLPISILDLKTKTRQPWVLYGIPRGFSFVRGLRNVGKCKRQARN